MESEGKLREVKRACQEDSKGLQGTFKDVFKESFKGASRVFQRRSMQVLRKF